MYWWFSLDAHNACVFGCTATYLGVNFDAYMPVHADCYSRMLMTHGSSLNWTSSLTGIQ